MKFNCLDDASTVVPVAKDWPMRRKVPLLLLFATFRHLPVQVLRPGFLARGRKGISMTHVLRLLAQLAHQAQSRMCTAGRLA